MKRLAVSGPWLVLLAASGLLVGAGCGDGAPTSPTRTPTPELTLAATLTPTATPTAPAGLTTREIGDEELAVPDGGDDAGRWMIEDARQFDEFSLYWLGDSYEGLPLTKIIRYRYDPEPPIPPMEAGNSVTFIYGTCEPPPDGGCAPPLSIVVEPYCMKPPERVAPAVRGTPFQVRGALAEQIGDHLRIWTGDISISIFTEPTSLIDAANQLRLVSEGPEGAMKPLGPPDPGC